MLPVGVEQVRRVSCRIKQGDARTPAVEINAELRVRRGQSAVGQPGFPFDDTDVAGRHLRKRLFAFVFGDFIFDKKGKQAGGLLVRRAGQRCHGGFFLPFRQAMQAVEVETVRKVAQEIRGRPHGAIEQIVHQPGVLAKAVLDAGGNTEITLAGEDVRLDSGRKRLSPLRAHGKTTAVLFHEAYPALFRS